MLRLLSLILALILGLAGMTLSARLMGSRNALSIAGLFTRPDGSACSRPCLFGVQPGQTTATEAAMLLQAHPLTLGFTLVSSDLFRIEGQADQIIMITFNKAPQSELVDEVTLATYPRFLQSSVDALSLAWPHPGSLGEIMSRYDSPDFVQFTRGGDALMEFSRAGLAVSIAKKVSRTGNIEAADQVSRLTVFQVIECPPDSFPYVFLRWAGIASFGRYFPANTVEVQLRPLNSAGVSFAPCQP